MTQFQSTGTSCPSIRARALVAAVSACFVCAPAWANPTGPQVINGSAGFNQAGKLLTVTNSNGAIINWNSFSIRAGETTRFNQASAASSVLNRVIANDPSVLLGTLSSNGKVWLVNPAGIIVGQGARIDVAGFVASTLNVKNEDFLAGRLNFGATPNAGSIQNYGQITTPSGGSVYLVAPAVENQGIINAPNGEVILAAGQTVNLIDTGTPGVKVDITGAVGNVTNLGQIVAEAGRIGMAGVLVKDGGSLNATSVVKEGGRIFLKATQRIELDQASQISADGTKGGQIVVKAEDGGKIAGELVARGVLSATGNGTKGSGGFVETSAAKVDISGIQVTTKGGTWLIDPVDVTIQTSGATPVPNASSTVSPTSQPSTVDVATLQTALNGGNSVTIDTQGGTGGNGDITVASAITVAPTTTGAALTLNAFRNIAINQPITATGNPLNLALNHASTGSATLASSLALAGGNLNIGTYNGSTSTPSVGSLFVTGGTTTLTGAFTASALNVSAGTFNINSAGPTTLNTLELSGSGSLGVTGALNIGTFKWTAAEIVNGTTLTSSNTTTLKGSGTGSVTVSGSLNMPAPLTPSGSLWNFRYLDGMTLNSGGTSTLGSGTVAAGGNGALLYLNNGATINNSGTWVLNYANISTNGIGTNTFNNLAAGVFSTPSSSDGGGSVYAPLKFNNSGSISINASVPGGGLTLGAAVANSGNISVSSGTALALGSGGFDWQGGTISGAGTVSQSSNTLSTTGTGTRVLNGPSLSSGALALSGGSLEVQSGTLSNSGTLTIGSGASLTLSGGTVSGSGITNNGTFNWSNGTLSGALVNNGTATFSTSGFSPSPTSYTGSYSGTGALTLSPSGGSYSFAPTLPVNYVFPSVTYNGLGTLNFDIGANISSLNLQGSSFRGNGAITIPSGGSLTVNGTTLGGFSSLTVSSGATANFTNAGIYRPVTNSGTLNVVGNSRISTVASTSGSNNGSLTNSATGVINLNGGYLQPQYSGSFTNSVGGQVNAVTGTNGIDASGFSTNVGTITNNGAVNVSGGASLAVTQGYASSGTGSFMVNSSGTLSIGKASGAPGAATYSYSTLTNNGATAFTGGTHTFGSSGLTGGSLEIQAGVLNLSSATTVSSGTLRGAGTLALNGGAGTLINGGSIAPGSATTTGTLTVQGNVSFATSGTLDERIGGASAGQYDVLAVSGAATLAGTLNSSITGGFTPNSQSFPVLTYGSRSGSFATLKLPFDFQNTYNAANLTLTHVPGSSGFYWTNTSGDFLWTTPSNWNAGRLPVSTDLVTMNASAGSEARVTSGTNTVGSLSSTANNSLVINGGSLTVLGTANLAGSTIVKAGQLTLSGSTKTLGATSLSGTGVLTLVGAIGATPASMGSLALSGGELQLHYQDGSGANALNVSGAFNWSAGTISSLDPSTGASLRNQVSANGVTNLSGSTLPLVAANLNFSGAVTQANGTTLDGQTSGRTSSVDVNGNYELQGGDIKVSVMRLNPGSSLTKAGTTTATIGTNGGTFQLNGMLTVLGGTLEIDNGTLPSGTLQGSGVVSAGATLKLGSTSGDTSVFAFAPGGNLTTYGVVSLAGRTSLNKAETKPTGTIEFDGASNQIAGLVYNPGTITQKSGSNNVITGTLHGDGGTVMVQAGALSLTDTTGLPNLGNVFITGGTLTTSGGSAATLTQLGGTLNLTGNLSVSGLTDWAGGSILNPNPALPRYLFANGSTLLDGTLILGGNTNLNLNGAATQSSAAVLQGTSSGGGAVNVSSTYDLQGGTIGGGWDFTFGTGSSLTGSGTISTSTIHAAAGSTVNMSALTIASGGLDLASNATVGALTMNGGTVSGGSDLTLTGVSTINNGMLAAGGKLINAAGGTLHFNPQNLSTLVVPRAVVNRGTALMDEGGGMSGRKLSLSGGLTNEAGASFTTPSTSLVLDPTIAGFSGDVTNSGVANIGSAVGATIHNSGTLNLSGNEISLVAYNTGTLSMNNAPLLTNSTVANNSLGTVSGSVALVGSSLTADLGSTTTIPQLTLSDNSTLTLKSPDASINSLFMQPINGGFAHVVLNASNGRLADSVQISSNVAGADITINQATNRAADVLNIYDKSGLILNADATIGTLNMQGGNISGSGVLTLSGLTSKTLSAADALQAASNPSLLNTGASTISAGTISGVPGSSTASTLANGPASTLNLKSAFDNAVTLAREVRNSGVVAVNGGIHLEADFTNESAGVFSGVGTMSWFGSELFGTRLANYGTIKDGATKGNLNLGAVLNYGTITAGGPGNSFFIADLSNYGTIAPGGPGVIGAIQVGQLHMMTPRGVLALDGIGDLYDVVGVSGNATLDGKLSFFPAADFNRELNNAVRVMSYGSRTGTFSSLALPVGFKEDYQPTMLNLMVLDRAAANDHVSQTVNQVVLQGNSTVAAASTANSAVVLPLVGSSGGEPLKLADAGMSIGGTEESFGGSSNSGGSGSGGDKAATAAGKTTGKPPPKKLSTCGR